jgi:putative PIN family toxin of toxin-antitoxin system
MRVVIDANVLIAAYAAHGLCEAILELCIANDDIYLTTEILADVRDKLVRKIKIPGHQADEIVEFLKNNSTIIEPTAVPKSICRDPDDRDILGAAKSATADYIITGDNDLLVLGEYEGTRIVKPRSHWEEFSKRKR